MEWQSNVDWVLAAKIIIAFAIIGFITSIFIFIHLCKEFFNFLFSLLCFEAVFKCKFCKKDFCHKSLSCESQKEAKIRNFVSALQKVNGYRF